MLDLEQLAVIADRPVNENMRSVLAGLMAFGTGVGLDRPHRLAHYIAQLAHESARFRYDKELWGPTPAQKRYDTRTDLGNTAARDGDGYLYRGRGPIQVTGKANYGEFTVWARQRFEKAPDFIAEPDKLLTDPWEGASPIWYWDTRNLNRYADDNNIEQITKRINGGLNGYADRLALYTRSALVLLRLDPTDIRGFQKAAGITVDGDPGPQTRDALHAALKAMGAPAPEVAPAPKPCDCEAVRALASIRALLATVPDGPIPCGKPA